MYNGFWSFARPKKILHLVSYKMLDFKSCFNLNQGNYFLMFSPLMREILHAWRDFFHSCGRFYMLAGRAGEIVSRRETPSQCGRVGSPGYLNDRVKELQVLSTIPTKDEAPR